MSIFRKEVAEAQGTEFARFARLLQDGTIRSPEWQGWLQASANSVQGSMQTAASLSDIKSLSKTMQTDDVLPMFRSLVAEYAQSLASWSDIRASAIPVVATLLETGQLDPAS